MEPLPIIDNTLRISDKFQLAMLAMAKVLPVEERIIGMHYYAWFPREAATKVVTTLESSSLSNYIGCLQRVENHIWTMRRQQRNIPSK